MGPRGRTDAYGQEDIPDSEKRGERDRDWMREKCASGQVFERERAMTIPELHAAIRERVPASVSTCVSFDCWHHAHAGALPMAVTVQVSVHYGDGECVQVTADTCDDAYTKFLVDLMPLVCGGSPANEAAERLAEMGV